MTPRPTRSVTQTSTCPDKYIVPVLTAIVPCKNPTLNESGHTPNAAWTLSTSSKKNSERLAQVPTPAQRPIRQYPAVHANPYPARHSPPARRASRYRCNCSKIGDVTCAGHTSGGRVPSMISSLVGIGVRMFSDKHAAVLTLKH